VPAGAIENWAAGLNDRIIGFTTFDGSSHELLALFNAEARRTL
jgi:hypothetical protein